MDRLSDKILKLFRRKKSGPIHLWYPDILHWEQGDKINCWNISSASNHEVSLGDIQKFRDKHLGLMVGDFIYKSVDKEGFIYLEDDDGNLWKFEFWRFIKYAENKSLLNRAMEIALKDSEEYMELMDHFQQAFNELQEKDNHPKRIGSANKIGSGSQKSKESEF